MSIKEAGLETALPFYLFQSQILRRPYMPHAKISR